MKLAACPPEAELHAYAIGALDDASADAIATHVGSCTDCLQRLDSAPADPLLAALRRQPAVPPAPLACAMASILGDASDVESMPELPGYRLLERIGEGGMGTVFKAVHERLGKVVAVKLIRRGIHAEPAAVARFRREALAVGALDHPNVVRATDAGEAGGHHYLVMEYVEGVTLARLVAERGPRPAREAIRYFAAAAAGLDCAHAQGVIHRDVKPSNLILSADGIVKVLDLGLALLPSVGPDVQGASASGPGLTEVGRAMGTRDYMAPEQRDTTHEAGPAADVFGLGATLWFLLTGTPPPRPLPSRCPAALPPGVWRKMLAENPSDRYPTVSAAARAVRRSRLARLARWPAAAAIIALATIGIWAAMRPLPPPAFASPPMTPDDVAAQQAAWARFLRVPVALDGDMPCRLIAPCEFNMAGECRVVITQPYYLGRCEVTVGQFRRFVEATQYVSEAEEPGKGGFVPNPAVHTSMLNRRDVNWRSPGYAVPSDDLPVTQVSWRDAAAYCTWLSGQTGKTYRLPTDAEWTWAARGGAATDLFESLDEETLTQYGWYRANSGTPPWTKAVGQLAPNAWGICDTFGNVCEWCRDWYGELPNGRFNDYAGPQSHPRDWHVVQGVNVGSGNRQRAHRWRGNSCGALLGFRVLCEIGVR